MRLYIAAVDAETDPTSNDEKFTSTVVPLAARTDVHQFIWCAGVFLVLVTIWTGLRAYSRRIRRLPLAMEDALYHISVISFFGFVVALFLALYLGGAGHHMNKLNKSHIARLTQSFLVIQALYAMSMCTVKWSMLFMLKRIFAVKSFEIVTWIIIGLQAGWLVMTVLIGFLICRPIQKNWDPTAEGTCGNQIAGYTAVSVVNVIIDVLMLLLPLPMVYRLQTRPGYKVGLFAIFSIGLVTIAFSAVRLTSLNSIDFEDFSYTVIPVMTWTTAEAGVAILVASSALLRPVFDGLFHRVLSLSSVKTPGPSNVSDPYMGSQSRMNAKQRREFVNVGHSEESLELETRGPRTEIQAGARRSKGTLDAMTAAAGGSPERKGRMTIVVQQRVEQTYEGRSV
ncbi:putative integral membrane protein [Diaporthe ampelina]|uniref:Putative integral membrane protein n=1 Tax=Diaporthe ampelina TaxID=1214573 RepID=A0A0G2FR64_9PEZI|nr:putative integral membrane protein [Diaporthe ampelina]